MKKKTISQMKKLVWAEMSRVLRIEQGGCQRCLLRLDYRQLDAHHIIPRSRGNSVYFLRDNILILCKGCHFSWWHYKSSPQEQMELVLKVLGEERWAQVEKEKNKTVKFSTAELETMLEYYKKRVKELST